MAGPTYHFILNALAGNGRGRRNWQQLQPKLMQTGMRHTVTETTGPGDGHPQALAAALAAQPGDIVVAIGGDGTMGEVAGGIVASGRAHELALGLIPSGTGNDFARTLQLPADAQRAFAVVTGDQRKQIDLGNADGHSFINIAGVGFDAAVANAANNGPKFLGGTVPYVLGLLRTLWGYRPVRMELDIDGAAYTGRYLLVAVANGRYFGGGMNVAPHAEIADGTFDVVIAGNIGRLATLRLLPRIYKGTHLDHPDVMVVRGRSVTMRTLDEAYCQADGELLPAVPERFSVNNRALSVCVP